MVMNKQNKAQMWLNSHHWHFDYVRLARDTGFTFEKTKPPLDKNKICLIDLVKIIGEGDVGTIEHFMPSIVQYSIETGEHTGILDQNFLKIFRMSQLAVEYLLFCKKYLDHTVTLLKEEMNSLKLENKELKIFNDELKQHTDVLLEKLKSKDVISSFKCTKCSKAFSTEQYLTAHMERRHFYCDNVGNTVLDIEMEIKEIKQKLNNTEKLIKNEELNPKLEDTLNKNYSKVSELLLKFESLKIQVESDFKVLQSQKDFEDKYSIIFQSILHNMKNQVTTELAERSPYSLCEKRNSVTQTDFNNVQKIEKKIQVDTKQPSKTQFDERIFMSIEEQMNKNCEIITNTMTFSLKNLETQMRALWQKLQELEMKNTNAHEALLVTDGMSLEDKVENEEIESNPKSIKNEKRSEIMQVQYKSFEKVKEVPAQSNFSSKNQFDDLDKIDILEEVTLKPSRSVTIVKSANTTYEVEESESEEKSQKLRSSSESSAEESVAKISPKITKGKSSSTLGKRSLTSLRRASLNTEVRNKLRKEMEHVFEARFSALGLSLDWKGIPEQTYLRVMDILNHQSALLEKSYPDFKSIKKMLLKVVNQDLKMKIRGEAESFERVKPSRMKSVSMKSFTSRPSVYSPKKPQSAPQIEIRNRNMFDTDSSSSENLPKSVKRLSSNIMRRTVPYSAVIEELKQTQKSDENLNNHGDIPEKVGNENEEIEKLDVQTKGVLKNFSTTGPLPKKRVLFNLKGDSIDQKEFLKDVGEGSTTSIASSVLDISDGDNSSHDGKPDMKNDIEDLSDSDFSIFDDSNKRKIDPQL